MAQIPLVDYLALDPEPHLVAHECTSCGARFFDRRNACASCSGTDFKQVKIGTTGELRAFTIVTFAAPGVPNRCGSSHEEMSDWDAVGSAGIDRPVAMDENRERWTRTKGTESDGASGAWGA